MTMTATLRWLACLASLALAGSAAAEPMTISGAWVRATPPGAGNAAAYFTIANGGQADRRH
jgi:copper(I)-binding protein